MLFVCKIVVLLHPIFSIKKNKMEQIYDYKNRQSRQGMLKQVQHDAFAHLVNNVLITFQYISLLFSKKTLTHTHTHTHTHHLTPPALY